MLIFVFVNNPAVKSVAVGSDAAQTIDYSVNPILGSPNNCITVPSSGTVALTITGWRPQRPGDLSIGEAEYVDIRNSLITADIPNGPSASGPSSAQGPGNCASSSYTTTDTNLSVGLNGVEDGKADQDASNTNTYTFTLDVTQCLQNARNGAIAWNAGETLFIDLQFQSSFGDNAAQKFCVKRAAA